MNVWLPCGSSSFVPHWRQEDEAAILAIPHEVSRGQACVIRTNGSRIRPGSGLWVSVLGKLALGDSHTLAGPAWLHPL